MSCFIVFVHRIGYYSVLRCCFCIAKWAQQRL